MCNNDIVSKMLLQVKETILIFINTLETPAPQCTNTLPLFKSFIIKIYTFVYLICYYIEITGYVLIFMIS